MLVSLLPVPFADAARQRQFDALEAALRAETGAPATVLLGNMGAWAEFEADALLVRPHCVVLLVLTPRAGRLTIPALAYGSWQLDGQPLPGRAGSDNPFLLYQQQQPGALAWLGEHLGQPGSALPPCAGLALFEAPLTFGPEVEAQLHRHAAAQDFQLIGDAVQLPARLRQLAAAESVVLDAEELLEWGEYLANEPYVSHSNGVAENLSEGLATFLTQKLQQLWRWLGAEDIPADPPYGAAPTPDTHLRDQQEQARLQHLRQELQAELHQQRQEATTREAARTQELAQLRQQLAQAGLSATERRAEQQATAALEEELRTARAELAARNQELDTRIQQLGLLIKQLQAENKQEHLQARLQQVPLSQPTQGAAPKRRPAPSAPAARPTTAKSPSFRRLRQAERWGVLALALAGVGVGGWGVVRLAQRPKAQPATTAAHRRKVVAQAEEGAAPDPVYVVDGTLAVPAQPDTANATLHAVDSEPIEATVPPASIHASAKQPDDSAATHPPASPTPDSTTAPSPTP